MHAKGQLSPRERVAHLLDPESPWLEIGLLVAHDRYNGEAPAAGVITGLGVVAGRDVVIVANDATVKAGSWWPETITKILRAQEIAMRQRIPIVYLVDSAGVNLPYQEGVFPGQYGAARIFYYNSLMRRYLHVPQISAVMGSCIAGGAYLPALSDVIFMVEGTSFMGLGGPNLVKGATGQTVDGETLGGARTHTEISAVAHYRAPDDASCLDRMREYIGRLPRSPGVVHAVIESKAPLADGAALYDMLPADHRLSYDMRHILNGLLDGGVLDEFQPDVAREMLCGHARIEGRPVAVIANQRGVIKGRPGERPKFGGIIYPESAEKVAFFIETANREGLPILFVQDVSGFMVGAEAEHAGIIRAGAHFVEAMATASVPKIVLTVNHASGAGYYAMAGQGFDPDFILSWPTGRMAVMEGEAAIMAVHGAAIGKAQQEKRPLDDATQGAIAGMRADYEAQLDARYAAARGFVDAIVAPDESRSALAFLLRVTSNYAGPHLGPFVLDGVRG
ncbi:MAG: acyl-CoA carboxylase subunit beta [Gemmatimonadetes bacterium]|nr:acyl-CoA carboxylase subunit beta [Gemmatimonadota bacterium]MBP6443550.1 acyl-CoA carboxylase subunit beta [Gemmatimonadales bacterium]MBK9547655.1 acyl-CoA carboxylase subunit beta [Gemmatimonadota bacterium]MBP6570393.1 acyl-CoA carboxylase subunit beta [Gemmatimonadales bacterium]MBP7620716.1 acyl-CoA carboxylase subunit beta [Gemmatimonadales bacterium]